MANNISNTPQISDQNLVKSTGKSRQKKFFLLFLGLLINITTMTFGRFAYTLILPDMMRVLELTNTQMGMFGTGIVLGYLTSSVLSGRMAQRTGETIPIQISIFISSVSLFSLGFLKNNYILFTAFFGIGAGASGSYIPMVGILNREFRSRGRVFGFVMGGTGIGTMFCGYFIPIILSNSIQNGYRIAWITLAGINILPLILSFPLMKNYKKRKINNKFNTGVDNPSDTDKNYTKNKALALTIIVYFILGFSYIIYATFFGGYAINEVGFSRKLTGAMWSLFGINTIYSGILWGYLADRFNKVKIAIAVNAILAVSIFMIIPANSIPLFFSSTFLFGIAFMGFIVVITHLISSEVHEEEMAKVFGVGTFIHGSGQVIATFISGYLKDLSGTFRVPFGVSAFLLIIAIIILINLLKYFKNNT